MIKSHTHKIKIYSDTVCGWCYIGHLRIQKILSSLKDTSFSIKHVPFQLNPDMPKEGIKRLDYLNFKFGSRESAQPMYRNMCNEAIKEGLNFNLEKIKFTPNTVLSHILINLALKSNIETKVLLEVFQSYFIDCLDIGDPNILIKIGNSNGISGTKIKEAFTSSKELENITNINQAARKMGINAVPFFEINNKTYISGLQNNENLTRAIKAQL